MLKVAITGNIASGKSVVEQLLKAKGFNVLDTDCVTHELLKNKTVKDEISNVFQDCDIYEKNEISRPKLGKIVFENCDSKKKLEAILHPKIKDEIQRFFHIVEQKGEKIAFVSVPLLYETGFEKLFNKVILVYANDKVRLDRLMKRNNFSLEYAQKRLDSQISQDEKTSLADYIIYNDKTLKDLSSSLDEFIKLL